MTLTIRPHPWRIISGTTAFARANGAAVHRNEAAPLIGRDLPEFEGTLPAVRPDCSRADAGIVHQNVDASEPIAGGFGISSAAESRARSVRMVRRSSPSPCSRALAAKRLQRFSIAIYPRYPDACCQQSPHHQFHLLVTSRFV